MQMPAGSDAATLQIGRTQVVAREKVSFCGHFDLLLFVPSPQQVQLRRCRLALHLRRFQRLRKRQ